MFLSEEVITREIHFLGVSGNMWIILIVIAMILTAILTAAYNDDKTKGL
jgi:hypothetical protein